MFEEQDVDLQVFLSLTDNDLKEIGIKWVSITSFYSVYIYMHFLLVKDSDKHTDVINIQMSFIYRFKIQKIIAESDQVICFEFQIVWSKKKDDKCNSSLAKQSSNANQWQVGASLRRSSGRRDAGNGSSAFEGKKIWKYSKISWNLWSLWCIYVS